MPARQCLPLFGLLLLIGVPAPADAIPAFSRQIDADCRTCHFQDMHALNAYGREFKLNAFRETKEMRKKRLEREKKKRENPPEK